MKCKNTLLLLLAVVICAPGIAQAYSPLVKSFISNNTDSFAITQVRLIDGTGQPARADQTLVIIKGRIANMGNADKTAVPAGITIINGSGKTIIPGMIMMHEHLFYGDHVENVYLGSEMPVSFPRLYLAGGVTTMRTAGSVEPQTDLNIRNWIQQGTIAGPEIDVTGPYIERAGLPIPEVSFIKNPEEAANTVTYWADKGCTSFKLYMDITKADMKASIETAHKRGLKVTGHLCSITFREAAELGIDNLEHGFWVSSDFDKTKKENECANAMQVQTVRNLDVNSPAMKELMTYLISKNVAITSTLPVFIPYTDREIFPGGADEAVAPQIRETVEKIYHSAVGKDSATIAMFKKEMTWEKQFVDMGGRLMAGIDPTGAGRVIPGYADRFVPELLVEAGFTFPQAIKICTLNAAEYLGRDKEIGTIAIGKKADMVLIDGDPEKDIKDMRKTLTVFKNGVGFDSKKLFDAAKGKVGLF
jgi:imidazolonepropionase-like amidohydrolase